MPETVEWTKLFTLDEVPKVKVEEERCACGGRNCRTAKRIKCVCRCHSQFHGVEQRRGMEPLDKALGIERPKVELIPWFDMG